MHTAQTDRALGALYGGALGDALGMPSQTFTRRQIAQCYGRISDFVAPIDNHPVAHGLAAATITDDTEQSLLLAAQLIASGNSLDESQWARALIDWEQGVKKRNLGDLLGPSTQRALRAFSEGESADLCGRFGVTNGAAMRIAPVGIATPVEPLGSFVDQVESASRLTHNTAVAIAAAAAVAAAISAGVDGANIDEAIAFALAAAQEGESRGHARQDAGMLAAIRAALNITSRAFAEGMDANQACADVGEYMGTDVAARESVAVAFAVFMASRGDAWQAGLISANLGGDTDTIGAIATGMSGACCGVAALPAEKLATLVAVNHLELEPVAAALLRTRGRDKDAPAKPQVAP